MKDEHPVLGKIEKPKDDQNGYEAVVTYNGTKLTVSIDPDDQTADEAIEFAAAVVTKLVRIERESKAILIRDLLPTYNGGWNEYDEAQEDGTFRTVKNPQLNEAEFDKKFSLKSITTTGIECIDIWFDDSNLFWGHGVFVSALDGLDLSEADAQLFG